MIEDQIATAEAAIETGGQRHGLLSGIIADSRRQLAKAQKRSLKMSPRKLARVLPEIHAMTTRIAEAERALREDVAAVASLRNDVAQARAEIGGVS